MVPYIIYHILSYITCCISYIKYWYIYIYTYMYIVYIIYICVIYIYDIYIYDIYHIISYHIISYHSIAYHIISYIYVQYYCILLIIIVTIIMITYLCIFIEAPMNVRHQVPGHFGNHQFRHLDCETTREIWPGIQKKNLKSSFYSHWILFDKEN